MISTLDARTFIDNWEGKRITLIAPHPDDAAFSLAGIIALLAPHCAFTLVTVFTRSAWAVPDLLRQAGPEAIHEVRMEAERAFCQRFILDFSPCDFPDASLCGYDAVSERQELRDDDTRAENVTQTLRLRLATTLPDIVIAPATVGGHVDHHIVHRSLSRIPGTWRRVFYEDLPYAGEFSPAALETALRARGMDIVATVDIDAVVREKYSAMTCYTSQLEPATVETFIHYSQQLARRQRGADESVCHAERLWEPARQ